MEEKINKTQRERLAHIELLAYFKGHVTRKDIMNRFGVADAAASRDFSKYNDIAPDNLVYNTRKRFYGPSMNFKPVFEYSPSRVLSTISEGFGDGLRDSDDLGLSCEIPYHLSKPRLPTVARITRAISNKQILSITYRSLTSGETKREIAPHSLVDNGLRWHARAFDRRRERFTDFVLNRISNVETTKDEIKNHETDVNDQDWNNKIPLVIVPHPSLTYKETIEKDYGMKQGKLKVQLRAALAGYVLRRWNVDCSPGHSLKGAEYQLALENIDDLVQSLDTMTLAPGFAID